MARVWVYTSQARWSSPVRIQLNIMIETPHYMVNGSMGKYEKLLSRILAGRSDANISFNNLRRLLQRLGFEERIRSSHHIFIKEGVDEQINLQRDGSKVKSYQVRQVRRIILKYKLGGKEQ